jgi:superfamily I DNA/RNA helicase
MNENTGPSHTRVREGESFTAAGRSRNRAEQIVILGPPGTGKTTKLLTKIEGELAGGLRPSELAFVTFTRAARLEALDRITKRFGFRPDELPFVRTVHSACFQLLGLKRSQVMGTPEWREFAELYHYELTDEATRAEIEDPMAAAAPPSKTEDDHLRGLVGWAATRCLALADAVASYPERVDLETAEDFARRLKAFKDKRGLFTFEDMVRVAIDRGLRLPVRVLFVDEAQDLSPLQIAAIELWRERPERTYIAGDDDQAIYNFQGAEPAWLIAQSKAAGELEVLSKSWRIPAAVHELALSIISNNTERVVKVYTPRDELGEVIEADAGRAFDMVPEEGSVFVLARNRRFLAPWRERLLAAAEPFDGSPLSRPKVRAALAASKALRVAGRVTKTELLAMLALLPSGTLAPRGVKKMAARLGDDETVGEADLAEAWDMPDVVDLAMDDPVSLLVKGVSEPAREYIRRVLDRHEDIPEPRWFLSTIHGAKGREADTVLVLSDMLGASHRELKGDRGQAGVEAEHRVAYVAVTRARHRLIIVRPTGWRHFDYGEHMARNAGRTPRRRAA